MAFHKLDTGTWKSESKQPQIVDVAEVIYAAIGRRFHIEWMGNGKFHYMEGDFTAEEKATIKQILEDNGAI